MSRRNQVPKGPAAASTDVAGTCWIAVAELAMAIPQRENPNIASYMFLALSTISVLPSFKPGGPNPPMTTYSKCEGVAPHVPSA
ncbi:MAG: hypothetical protein QXZ09_10275, partial [Candidatus Methanomethylicaceae archaeon]